MKSYQYGYDIKKIDKNIYSPMLQKRRWGYYRTIIDDNNYALEQIFIRKGSTFNSKPQKFFGRERLVYLESGSVTVNSNNLKPKETLLFKGVFEKPIDIIGKEDSFIYIFSGSPFNDNSKEGIQKSKTFDRRQKDWAENMIETIVNRSYTGKKIFFKKGNKSSLHFHCKKTETYFIHSGRLLLRFKAGQGEDKFFVVSPGQAVKIPSGLMHQTGALKDLTIIEISTPDEDADSFIIESEFAKMPELKKRLKV